MRTVDARRATAAAATRAYSSSRSTADGCSRISTRNWAPGTGMAATPSSVSNERLAADEDTVDLEAVGEDDDVGASADLERADSRGSDHGRRNGARGPDSVRQRDAERVQVLH